MAFVSLLENKHFKYILFSSKSPHLINYLSIQVLMATYKHQLKLSAYKKDSKESKSIFM